MKLNIVLLLFILLVTSSPALASFSEIQERKQRALGWHSYYVGAVKPYKSFINHELTEHKASAFNWYKVSFESKEHFYPYLETDKSLHLDYALTWFEKHSR